MKRITILTAAVVSTALLAGCLPEGDRQQSNVKDTQAVERQQAQYQVAQPIPAFDYSLERDLLIQLYQIRNAEVATHTVWRSDYGLIEGDCPSIGFPLPYDTSLTNPLVGQEVNVYGTPHAAVAVGQPEPNGVFASVNTSASWVFCVDPSSGAPAPIYVESKATGYPMRVTVDYDTNRVVMSGDPTVTMTTRGE